jgi:aquaporin related protein
MKPTFARMSLHGVNQKDTELGFPHAESSSTPTRSNTGKQQHSMRAELAAFLGEFIGTFMFLSLAFVGAQIALNAAGSDRLTSSKDTTTTPDTGKLLYIAFAFGVSLAINVAIFADISGGKFNPAVGLAQRSRPTPVLASRRP